MADLGPDDDAVKRGRNPSQPFLPLRTLVVDGDKASCRRMSAVLRGLPDVRIVGEAHDRRELLILIYQTLPDLLIVDIDTFSIADFWLERHLEPSIVPILIALAQTDWDVADAFRAGAADFVLKPARGERLERAVAHARALIPVAARSRYACGRPEAAFATQPKRGGIY